SDDGSKLWINEQLLVENDGLHALQERLGVMYLPEGYHPIRVTFFDRKYADGLQVSYEATGIAKQAIPSEVLFTDVLNQPSELAAPAPLVRADAGDDLKLSLDTENVVLNGRGQSPYPFRRYLWEKVSGPDISITGQNTANVHLHKPALGVYVFRFTAEDSEGNQGSDEIRLEVGNQTARSTYQASKLGNEISTTDVTHKIYVYPNPTKDVINLATTSGESRLPFRLYNQQGQLVHEGEVKPQAERASIELFEKYFKSGIYVLKVYSQQLGTQTFRLLKE
ncbi:MAG: T9SS type A sorting domain-containing protein, partial [Tunicatimonas sp.]